LQFFGSFCFEVANCANQKRKLLKGRKRKTNHFAIIAAICFLTFNLSPYWRIFLVLKAENNLESEVELNLQKRKDNLTK
jgi:hypothetical protein